VHEPAALVEADVIVAIFALAVSVALAESPSIHKEETHMRRVLILLAALFAAGVTSCGGYCG